jgi:hypothetical protein
VEVFLNDHLQYFFSYYSLIIMLPCIVKKELSDRFRVIRACFLFQHDFPLLPYRTWSDQMMSDHSPYTVTRCGS